MPARALAHEALDLIAERKVDIVCLSALRPFAVMQARYLAKRIRARFPQVKIVVGLWDGKKSSEAARNNLESAKPDWIVNTLGRGDLAGVSGGALSALRGTGIGVCGTCGGNGTQGEQARRPRKRPTSRKKHKKLWMPRQVIPLVLV